MQTNRTLKVPNILCNSDFSKVNCLKFFENIHVKLAVLKSMLEEVCIFSLKVHYESLAIILTCITKPVLKYFLLAVINQTSSSTKRRNSFLQDMTNLLNHFIHLICSLKKKKNYLETIN